MKRITMFLCLTMFMGCSLYTGHKMEDMSLSIDETKFRNSPYCTTNPEMAGKVKGAQAVRLNATTVQVRFAFMSPCIKPEDTEGFFASLDDKLAPIFSFSLFENPNPGYDPLGFTADEQDKYIEALTNTLSLNLQVGLRDKTKAYPLHMKVNCFNYADCPRPDKLTEEEVLAVPLRQRIYPFDPQTGDLPLVSPVTDVLTGEILGGFDEDEVQLLLGETVGGIVYGGFPMQTAPVHTLLIQRIHPQEEAEIFPAKTSLNSVQGFTTSSLNDFAAQQVASKAGEDPASERPVRPIVINYIQDPSTKRYYDQISFNLHLQDDKPYYMAIGVPTDLMAGMHGKFSLKQLVLIPKEGAGIFEAKDFVIDCNRQISSCAEKM